MLSKIIRENISNLNLKEDDIIYFEKEEFNKLNDMLNDDMYKANKYANILMPIANNLGNLQYVLIAIVGT